MKPLRRRIAKLLVTKNPAALGLSALLLLAFPLLAQRDRILGPIDAARTTALFGNVNPGARAQFDQGPLDPATNLSDVRLVLKSSAAQQAALQQLLRDQQDPSSPDFRNWLTPEQFADRFGLSANDIARLTSWLQSTGLTVNYVARSRTWIAFSGTAGLAAAAFQTEFHRYQIGSETHFANAREPRLPAAIAGLVIGITGLDDFHPRPAVKARPAFTGNSGNHYLSPDDLATIYDILPLYQNGVDGSGQKLAIIGQTAIDPSVVTMFQNTFGLDANPPQRVLYGTDPGVKPDDLGEAQLDLEWSAAVARHATIIYVYSQDVFTSASYAIDQNIAPVMSLSYGLCEPGASANTSPLLESAAQQANAQGITWLASSGDSGAAACDASGSAQAQYGLAVSLPASIPEVTAVGGSEFAEGGGSYWNSSNSSTGASALSYIPEMAWNDSAAGGGLSSTGGGASVFYSKPSWQTGPGVPNDGARDVPDLSLTASADHDGYIVCCDSNGQAQIIGGTSASTPSFAGIMTLLNQYLVNQHVLPKAGLGNINPMLYRMAQSEPAAFHDITAGGNIVPCQSGTPDCSAGSLGYSAGPGYDQATGLGSVDAAQFVNLWPTPAGGGATVVVTANPINFTLNGSTVLTATVRSSNASVTPTGSISFVSGATSLGVAALQGAGGTATASISVYGSQLAVGSETITAVYAGNSNLNGGSASLVVNITEPVAAAVIVPSSTPNPVYEQPPDADGYSWFFTITLTETNGVPATLTSFTFAGTDYSSSIPAFFGSSSIPADGTLSAALRAKIAKAPSTLVLEFAGADANGNSWTQKISIPFYGRQISASLAVSGSPSVVLRNPDAPPNCQFLQQLELQEQNGYAVTLTRFLAGGTDYTSKLQQWFGSLRVPPFGALAAQVCWPGVNPPQTLQYEIDGLDSGGNEVVATGSTAFQGQASNPGVFSLSTDSLALGVASPANSARANISVDVPPGKQWNISVFPSSRQTSWLLASPLAGAGPAQISIIASGAGLTPGVYMATLAFQSGNTIPQLIDVPVTFTIGASPNVVISGISNGASFQPAFAPGMILSVFGTNLATGNQQATVLPLPETLSEVSASVNGIPAPLYFVSPRQLNIQLPYETTAGPALLAVVNNGQVATYPFQAAFTAPGIFTDGLGDAVPDSRGTRGQTLTLFITGEGDVTPPLATGSTPASTTPLSQLPKPRFPVSLTVGGVPATIAFVGIPPGLTGVTQVNFTVPGNAPLGSQPVVVTVGSASSNPAKLTVTQ